MLSSSLLRAVGARIVMVVVAALILGLGLAVVPGLAAVPSAHAAESPDCACAEVGPFVAPDPGVAPDLTLVTPDLAVSPRGGYELVRAGSTATIARAGKPGTPLLSLALTGPDRRWGFSPDDSRFLTWTLGAGQLISWQLYDLTGTSARLLRDEQGIAASSMNFAFSSGGQRLVVGVVKSATVQEVSVYSALTGKPSFTVTAPIVFPAYDPGAGSDPGGPTAPRNVDAEVPKKTTDIEITWDDPYYSGDGPLAGYTLEVVGAYAPEGATREDVGPRHVRLKGYTPGVKYTFELRIVNRWGKKSPPVQVSAKIPLPKPAPTPKAVASEDSGTPAPDTGDEASRTSAPDPGPQSEPEASPAPDPSVDPDDGGIPGSEAPPLPDDAAPGTPEEPTMDDPASPSPPAAPSDDSAGTTAFPLTSGRLAADDPITTSGWGFSPDADARYLLLADSDGTRPRVRVYDTETGKTTLTRSITTPSAEWGFSPCAGALGVVELSSSWRAQYTLLDTGNGQVLATAEHEAKKSFGFTVQQVGESLFYYYWADGTGRMLTQVPDCGPPPPPPPVAPTGVTATAATGRAVVAWQHPDADIQEFEVIPYRDGVAQDPVTVDGRQRTAVLGTGEAPLPAGSYTFRVAARGIGGRSADSVLSGAARVFPAPACGTSVWSQGPASGTATGLATPGGVQAAFSYTVSDRTVTFRVESGPSRPATVLDTGRGEPVSYPSGGTSSRVQSVTYPLWGDYLASVVSTGVDGAVSIATAVIHVAPGKTPANDAFSAAAPLTGTAGAFDAATRWTTCEAGEPGTDDTTLTQWFTFQSPDEGTLIVSDPFSQVNAYQGATLTSLEPLGVRRGRLADSQVHVRVEAGMTVHLQVVASGRAETPRAFEGQWRFVRRPANDDIAKAIVIDPAATAEITGDLGAATVQTAEPDACEECQPRVAASVWYRWTATSDAHVWFRAPGGYAALDLFESDDTGPLGLGDAEVLIKAKRNEMGVRQESGRTYFLRASVDEVGLARWDSEFVLDVTPAPPNDLPRDAIALTGSAGQVSGSNLGGYVEAIPPQSVDHQQRTSMVWYSWTAPVDGSFSFAVQSPRGQIVQPEAFIYLPEEGAAEPTPYEPAVIPSAAQWRSARTTFVATAGETYLVAVTGVWLADRLTGVTEGDFVLRWGEATVPAAPEEVTAENVAGSSAVTLTWAAVDDGNADLSGYRITADPALPIGTVIDLDADDRRARVEGLLPGVAYELRVAAVNAVGVGRYGSTKAEVEGDALTLDPLRIDVDPGGAVAGSLVARGGTEPYTYALRQAPAWISVDASGALTGTAPEEPTTAQILAAVTDGQGATARRTIIVQVGEPGPVPVAVEVPDPLPSGWYGGEVTVVLTSVDLIRATRVAAATAVPRSRELNWALDGAQSGSGSTAGEASVTISREGETTLRYWADDPALARTLSIRIDTTAPTVTIVAPDEGATYPVGAVPHPDFSCADAGSGVVACEVVPPPALLPAAVDERVLAVRAVDGAGHSTTVVRSYRVVSAGSAGPVDPGMPPAGRPSPPPNPVGSGSRADGESLARGGGGGSVGLLPAGAAALLLGALVLRVSRRRWE